MKIVVTTATICDGKYYAPNTELDSEEEYLNRMVDSGVAEILEQDIANEVEQDVAPKRRGRAKSNK